MRAPRCEGERFSSDFVFRDIYGAYFNIAPYSSSYTVLVVLDAVTTQ